MINAVDHIGIAVADLEESMGLYKTIFGVTEFHREKVEEQGVDIASFTLNGVRIELTASLNEDSPIASFIAKRGDLQRLASNDIRLINSEPQLGAHDMLISFLHPKSTGGVLMELCSEKQ